MSNSGTATFLTTAAVARFHHHEVQANVTCAIAAAKQPRDLLPVRLLRSAAVSHLPPFTPEPMPAPEPTPEHESEPLPARDPEPRPEQEPLWSLQIIGGIRRFSLQQAVQDENCQFLVPA